MLAFVAELVERLGRVVRFDEGGRERLLFYSPEQLEATPSRGN